MTLPVIFAHVTGGTYAKRATRERVSGAGICTVRRNVALVTAATAEHERKAAAEYTWPALPTHLRNMPDSRAMVRHWVRTGYEWK